MNEQYVTTGLEFQKKVIGVIAQDFIGRGTKAPDRPSVHAMKDLNQDYTSIELVHVRVVVVQVPSLESTWATLVEPNLPWAEEHFHERISGIPLNPPPSHERWPFAQRGNTEHRDESGRFSHTYPERFWPVYANDSEESRRGIRFMYGDLHDLMMVLKVNSWSRQAYLPVWFPEDLTASNEGQRVPCTLGYHFMRNPRTGLLDMEYHIRSCDFVRFFKDDIYMAGRLLQHVADRVGLTVGTLVMNIANLHIFQGDLPLVSHWAERGTSDEDDWEHSYA